MNIRSPEFVRKTAAAGSLTGSLGFGNALTAARISSSRLGDCLFGSNGYFFVIMWWNTRPNEKVSAWEFSPLITTVFRSTSNSSYFIFSSVDLAPNILFSFSICFKEMTCYS